MDEGVHRVLPLSFPLDLPIGPLWQKVLVDDSLDAYVAHHSGPLDTNRASLVADGRTGFAQWRSPTRSPTP